MNDQRGHSAHDPRRTCLQSTKAFGEVLAQLHVDLLAADAVAPELGAAEAAPELLPELRLTLEERLRVYDLPLLEALPERLGQGHRREHALIRDLLLQSAFLRQLSARIKA
jgi:hypothetical protein